MGAGWQVRGTTRRQGGTEDILGAGLEAVVAHPDRVDSILDQVGDVTLVFWLLGSARGGSELVGAIHGPRLERLLSELVDTPVRGFVYEAAGTVGGGQFAGGAALVRAAGERWRIPVAVIDQDPGDCEAWREAMLAAAERLTG